MQVIRSNHKVNVDQRIIHTFFQNFLVAHLQKSIEHLRETGASCNVTACVFIEKGIKEHQPGLVNRRFFRNECNLAEHCSTGVHGEHFFQNLFALLCVAVNDFSILEIDGKVVDDLSRPA